MTDSCSTRSRGTRARATTSHSSSISSRCSVMNDASVKRSPRALSGSLGLTRAHSGSLGVVITIDAPPNHVDEELVDWCHRLRWRRASDAGRRRQPGVVRDLFHRDDDSLRGPAESFGLVDVPGY